MSRRRRAYCRVCRRLSAMTGAGVIFEHNGMDSSGERCEGSRRPPMGVPEPTPAVQEGST